MLREHRRFHRNLTPTGSVDLHAGEKRQEWVCAHRDNRVVIERDQRCPLLRGEVEALGIGFAVGQIFGASVRVMS